MLSLGRWQVVDCRRRGRAFWGPCLIVLTGLIPAATFAESKPTANLSPDQSEAKALLLEKDGQWNEALQIWCRIYGQDRQNDDANKHIQICLRRIFQVQRQSDKSLREKVLSLSHSQALALYTEVLTTLHSAYVDRDRVAPNRLFQQGLDEFLTSLNDPRFRKQNMASVSVREISEFQSRVREFMTLRTADSVPEAVALVKQIATTAKRDLQIDKTSVVVLEFIAGACNSLDEYTSYLSPDDLVMAEARMEGDLSVVDTQYLKDGIGYFKITHFRESTADEVDAAIAALKMSPQSMMGLKALVIDLRDNTGGLFSGAVQVVERFIPEGVIVSTQGRLDEFNKVHNACPKMHVIDLPLVVLVNGTTASAAEVLAAALRDHQRATLVGTPTYGKGSIQRILQFQTAEETEPNGKSQPRAGGLRITLARFFSPNGQAINGAGINPHVLERGDERQQLQAAIEQASRYVSAPPTMMMSPSMPPTIR